MFIINPGGLWPLCQPCHVEPCASCQYASSDSGRSGLTLPGTCLVRSLDHGTCTSKETILITFSGSFQSERWVKTLISAHIMQFTQRHISWNTHGKYRWCRIVGRNVILNHSTWRLLQEALHVIKIWNVAVCVGLKSHSIFIHWTEGISQQNAVYMYT